MFTRIVLSAAGAGLAVGLAVAALQHVTTTRLIVEAEVYEAADKAGPAADHGGEAWTPEDGLERTAYTALTTSLAGIGFALMLLAAMVWRGGRIDGRAGVLWGACGFAAVALAPSLGLPPELPGNASAALLDRQVWWTGTVIATAGAIGLLAFARPGWAKALAIALLALPHAIGAPEAGTYASAAPAELAGHFAAASLVVAAVFWVALGWAAATLYDRLAPQA